jgi:hypothetical protein
MTQEHISKSKRKNNREKFNPICWIRAWRKQRRDLELLSYFKIIIIIDYNKLKLN